MGTKTIDELKKLNTRRLLRYYKAERKRYLSSKSQYGWGFDKVDYMWDHSDNYEKEKIKYQIWNDYLEFIKVELNKRENIN